MKVKLLALVFSFFSLGLLVLVLAFLRSVPVVKQQNVILVKQIPPQATSISKQIKTVFVLVLENKNWDQVKDNPSASYLNTVLLPQSSYASAYYNPPNLHPSEPNYIWLEAGTNSFSDHTFTSDADAGPMNSTTNHEHLTELLDKSGISWKSYQESIEGKTCPLLSTTEYAAKHNPMIFFQDVTDDNLSSSQYCIKHVRPLNEFHSDLTSGKLPQYNFLTPNICHDMHDSCPPSFNPVKQGDEWLSQEIPRILNSDIYKKQGVLFITWDEGSGGDGPIGMLMLSPFAKGNGYTNTMHYTHSSLLRTIQEIFHNKLFLGDAASALDLSDFFRH